MIRAGQIYEAVKPNPGDPHNTRRRIRIVSEPGRTHGVYGYGKVTVETLRPDGTGTRQRRIELTQLHQTATTKTGTPRSNGYVLIQDTEEQR
jgi:hypothetical protein